MNRKEAIIITSTAGAVLLVIGYIQREVIQRKFRKFKNMLIKKIGHSPASLH